jgi:trk system potassium uptake protein TrkH
MTLPVNLLASSEAPNAMAFAESAAICLGIGIIGVLLTRRHASDLKPRFMFVLTVSSWFIIALLSCLPFYLSDLDITL